MLAVTIYVLIWLFAAAAGAVLYYAGNFGLLALIIFGEIVFGLLFIGIIGLLLSGVVYRSSPESSR